MKQLTGRFKVYKALLNILLLVYFLAAFIPIVMHMFQVDKPSQILNFFSPDLLFIYAIIIAIGLLVHTGLRTLIERRHSAVANREENAARLREESARFTKTATRMTGITLSQREIPNLTPIMEWCTAATKYVPKGRRGQIYSELADHLLDHRDALVANGYSVDAAERAAIASMGDPETTAQKLRKSERTLTGLLKQLKYIFVGRSWTVLLNSDDEQRSYQLTHLLSVAGVPFRAEQRNRTSYRLHAMSARYGMGNDSRLRGVRHMTAPTPGVAGAWSSATAASDTPKMNYLVYVRKRDVQAAQRLLR